MTTYSNLTSSYDELKAATIAALEDDGYEYNPLTTTFTEYLAASLTAIGGSAASSRAMSLAELMAGLANELGADLVSHLTSSPTALLALIREDLPTPLSALIQAKSSLFAYFQLREAAGATSVADIKGGLSAPITGGGTTFVLGQTALYPNGRATAAAFSGGMAQLSTANSAALESLMDASKPFSFEAVIYPNVTRSGGTTFYSMFSNFSTKGFECNLVWNNSLSKTTLDVQLQNVGTTDQLRVSTPAIDIPNALPMHVCVTYDGSKAAAGLLVYVGGIPVVKAIVVNTLTTTIAADGNSTIGRRSSGALPFQGRMSDVAIYNAVLTPTEILSHAGAMWQQVAPRNIDSPVNLIVNNDWAADVDGVVMLGILCRLQQRGEVVLTAIGCYGNEAHEAPMVQGILQRYGITGIPIGVSNQAAVGTSTYAQAVYNRLVSNGHIVAGLTAASYSTNSTIFRTALAAASIGLVWAEAAPPNNFNTLMATAGDGISPLTGAQLVAAKVRRIVAMMAEYPTGGSSNGQIGAAATSTWLLSIPTSVELVIDSHIQGVSVYAGADAGADPLTNPIRHALDLWDAANPGLLVNGKRQAYDGLTGLEAVRGTSGGTTFAYPWRGLATVSASTGNFTYSPSTGTKHYASAKLMSDAGLQSVMDGLIAELV